MPNSIKYVSRAFKVPRTTLRRRRGEELLRCDIKPNLKKLDTFNKEAIIRRILKLDI
jgi:hypothetical protein